MPTTESTAPTRKQLGAWCTPEAIVDLVVDRTLDHTFAAAGAWADHRPVRVLDPACGDGRFLAAAARRLSALGRRATLTGVDIDPGAIAAADTPGAEMITADSLLFDWGDRHFDVVVGNPPFLSQMSASTTRGGSSRHGGGPYADAAAEFLALAIRLADPHDGRVGLVLPQSILASRDAGPVRRQVSAAASMNWSWWSPDHVFDAQVLVCALGFRVGTGTGGNAVDWPAAPETAWARVVTDALGVPQLPSLAVDGTVGDRAGCTLNFRDEYYGLVPAVSDTGDGPPLVTSGLIDPGRCHWGERPVRFAKREFSAPRVDIGRLDARMQNWARRKLVPKVLVANQTRIVEAVADSEGAWLPGVPVISLMPTGGATVWELAAVLTSPVAAAAAWHAAAGTGLSARAIRLGPAALAAVPWPAGDLAHGVQLLRDGDVLGCGRAVTAAYSCGTNADGVAAGVAAGAAGAANADTTGGSVDDPLFDWWSRSVIAGAGDRPASSSAPSPAIRRSSTSARARPSR